MSDKADSWESMARDPRFYDWWRIDFPHFATLVEQYPEGRLYYHDALGGCIVSALACSDSVFVSYGELGDNSDEARDILQSWLRDLQETTAGISPVAPKHWIRPCVYAARRSSVNGPVLLGKLQPGDWWGLFTRGRNSALPQAMNSLPRGWPETHRDRIAELAALR